MHGWNSIPDRNQQVIKWKEEFDDQTCMWCSEPLFCDESHGELLFSKQCKQAMDIFQSNGNAVCLIQNFLWIFIEEKFPFPKCCHVLRLCSRTLLRVSAMTTTTRFPLFKASIVNPAVGKGAGWIRSEILIIFLFFTSLIGLLRAEINWFQWDDRVMNDGDADHLCSNWSRTRILQIESIFHQIVDGHWSLHIQSQWFHYNFPLVLACTANLENTPHFLKNVTPSEKRSPWPPKKWKLRPFFFVLPEFTWAWTFCKKPGPIWSIWASGASFLIYTRL